MSRGQDTGWQLRSLAALGTYLNGFAFRPQHWGKDGLPIVRIRELLDASVEPDRYEGQAAKAFQIDDGDLIFSWSATLAVIFWNRGPAYLNQHLFKVTPVPDVDIRFLHHLINFHLHRLSAMSHGTTMKHITRGDLDHYLVWLPGLDEQRRMADALDALDERISSHKRVVHKLERAREGLIHDLLSRKDFDQFVPLGSLADIGAGVTLGSEPSGPGTVARPYLRVANVQDGRLDLREIKFVRVRLSDLARFELQPGDVLMNEGGDADKLGRGAVWEGQIAGCLHQNHVFRVRCHLRQLNPHYLSLVTGSAVGKRYFLAASKQTTNLATINSQQIRYFPVPFRSTLLQLQIVEAAAAFAERIDVERSQLAKARLLKSGLIADLLTGRVRVPAEVAR